VRWIECQRLAYVERHGHVKGNLAAMAVDVGQQTRNQGGMAVADDGQVNA
jgi:hypothetical protein